MAARMPARISLTLASGACVSTASKLVERRAVLWIGGRAYLFASRSMRLFHPFVEQTPLLVYLSLSATFAEKLGRDLKQKILKNSAELAISPVRGKPFAPGLLSQETVRFARYLDRAEHATIGAVRSEADSSSSSSTSNQSNLLVAVWKDSDPVTVDVKSAVAIQFLDDQEEVIQITSRLFALPWMYARLSEGPH